jgi:histone demethylase JARID1
MVSCSLSSSLYLLTRLRYHGKCLKIARGKVKEDEKYTCPICDWRVRIPRDAARPKLEDLQAWQDEIPNLPFQPDEEQILEKIINNAQEFRQHVAPFCNPVMATADEAETQRFYLRKIEGAEILLAYETNFFRQELHKWSPVAPEPPPVLESSKSTRKPRPTKLQKLMAQHGVDDPEALPQNLRTKPHTFKRKSSEPQAARPQPLQPAPGRSDSGTPTSHTFPVSSAMGHHGLQGPILSGLHDGSAHAHPTHYGGFAGVQDGHFNINPRESSREAFTPHAFLNSDSLQGPGFGGVSPRQSAMFNDRGFGAIDGVATLGGVGSPIRDSFGGLGSSQGLGGSTPAGGQDLKQMFNDLTNQADEDDSQPSKGKGENGEKERERDGETKWEEGEDMELFFDGP